MFDDEYEEISEFWPENFHEVVYTIGETNALELVKTLGKITLNVPRYPENAKGNFAWHTLRPELQAILFKEFSGDRLYIPKLNLASYEVKTKAIMALSRHGCSVVETAYIIGDTEEAVYHARRKRLDKIREEARERQQIKALPAPN